MGNPGGMTHAMVHAMVRGMGHGMGHGMPYVLRFPISLGGGMLCPIYRFLYISYHIISYYIYRDLYKGYIPPPRREMGKCSAWPMAWAV
jgi:hypothetical protein